MRLRGRNIIKVRLMPRDRGHSVSVRVRVRSSVRVQSDWITRSYGCSQRRVY